jgi:DnaJ-like protein
MGGRRPWFEVLDVSPVASPGEVREAYLVLVKRWHPDRFTSTPERAVEAEERVKAINAAYDEARRHDGVWSPRPDDVYDDVYEADWPEWAEAVEPARVRLLFVPAGLPVRVVAFMLMLVFLFFAIGRALNALDLVVR